MIDKDTFNKEFDFNGSKGLLFFDDKIPVYRRDFNTHLYPGYVDLPGGGRDEKESPFDTFRREVKEEFGLIISKNDLVFSQKTQSMIDLNLIAFFMVVKLKKEKASDILMGDEGSEYFFLSMDDFLKREDVIPELKNKVLKLAKLGDQVAKCIK